MNAWRRDMAALEDPGRDPVAPQYLMATISELAADDAVLTCDSGTIATWAPHRATIATTLLADRVQQPGG
jgi:thiamine pyrophosphate-dependent acetolactate synthase large subunit-like protein